MIPSLTESVPRSRPSPVVGSRISAGVMPAHHGRGRWREQDDFFRRTAEKGQPIGCARRVDADGRRDAIVCGLLRRDRDARRRCRLEERREVRIALQVDLEEGQHLTPHALVRLVLRQPVKRSSMAVVR
jgi:hypothetical protein